MSEVSYYRAFRVFKNGGMVAMDLNFGISSVGHVLVPAMHLGISDSDTVAFAGNPDMPVVIQNDTIFIDIRHAINFFESPAIKQGLETVRKAVLLKFHD
jgi:hypothetical protein